MNKEIIPVVGTFKLFEKFCERKALEYKLGNISYVCYPNYLETGKVRYVLANTLHKVLGLDFKRHVYLYGAFQLDEVDDILKRIKFVEGKHLTYKQ